MNPFDRKDLRCTFSEQTRDGHDQKNKKEKKTNPNKNLPETAPLT
jgi:hypothetical protein